jgi:hypothetical protein
MGKKFSGVICKAPVIKASFQGQPTTKEQIYELTYQQGATLCKNAIGARFDVEHIGERWGEVKDAYFDINGSMCVDWEADDTLAGETMTKWIENGVLGLSLHHDPNTLEVLEVSLVVEGARPETKITSIKASGYKDKPTLSDYRTVKASALQPVQFNMSHTYFRPETSSGIDVSSLNTATAMNAIGMHQPQEQTYAPSSSMNAVNADLENMMKKTEKRLAEANTKGEHAAKIKALQEDIEQKAEAEKKRIAHEYYSSLGKENTPAAPATEQMNEMDQEILGLAQALTGPDGTLDPKVLERLKKMKNLHSSAKKSQDDVEAMLSSTGKQTDAIISALTKEHFPNPESFDPSHATSRVTVAASIMNLNQKYQAALHDNLRMSDLLKQSHEDFQSNHIASALGYTNTIAASNKRARSSNHHSQAAAPTIAMDGKTIYNSATIPDIRQGCSEIFGSGDIQKHVNQAAYFSQFGKNSDLPY